MATSIAKDRQVDPKHQLPAPPQRGRPREFDRADALRKAMRLFWAKGFEATTMADLRAKLGLTQASLYAAYGSKEQLFYEAVDLYRETDGATTAQALLHEPTARLAIDRLLRDAVKVFTGKDSPGGCLVVLGALHCADESQHVQEHIAVFRRQTAKDIAARLQQAQRNGEVPHSADTTALAAYFSTVLHGLSLQAHDGASRKLMTQIVDHAMASWPP